MTKKLSQRNVGGHYELSILRRREAVKGEVRGNMYWRATGSLIKGYYFFTLSKEKK